MANRFTNIDKWHKDRWFIDLQPMDKLVFIYLCDNCDHAGFMELSIRTIAFDIGTNEDQIKESLVNLKRCFTYSLDESKIFIRNFLKHQKNLPLNEQNKAHLGAIRLLYENLNAFGCSKIEDFIPECINSPCQGSSKGLDSPTGIGIGIGIGNKGGLGGNFNIQKQSKIVIPR
jgi:hypothetical protein